jgi:hypothetical protein
MTDPDTSHRIHMAANDPAFAQKREAAVQIIADAIAAVVLPLGYAQTGLTWARETAAGKTAVHLQRSRYGFDASIILRFVTPTGDLPDDAVWQAGDDIGLDRFAAPGMDAGVLIYLDVLENPGSLDRPMATLRNHALPWLDAHHAGRPVLADYVSVSD